MKDWSNLAKVVYRRTYARNDYGITETWNQTIDRVIEGNLRTVQGRFSSEELEKEEKQLRYLALNRKAGPAGRGYWFSGAPSHKRIGGAALNNCFSGDTQFIADGRIQDFHSLVGQTVQVVCSDGKERPAVVSSFGKQKLNQVRFGLDGRSRLSYVYNVTPNHRWITQRGETTELKVGDKVKVEPRASDLSSQSYKDGLIHGLIFGDGTQHTYYPERFMIRLCKDKSKHLESLESSIGFVSTSRHVSSEFEPIVTIKSAVNFKQVPSDAHDWNYQAGFVAGWFAADGSTRGRLGSTNWEGLTWLKQRAPLLGFTVRGDNYDSNLETNFGKRSRQIRTLTICPETTVYTVQEIIKTDIEEEVFCVTEPETNTFTLEGGIPTGNCWFITSEHWENYVIGMDLLMLGGGVGISVEHKYVSKLPKIKKDVTISHRGSKDADFIVPDSREGWCELGRRILESYFETGKSFTFSTVCIRGYGEKIVGFGGKASGPIPLIEFADKLCKLLGDRSGRHVRPIDAMDILCLIGELVVSGNVRRSAIIILGDGFDKDYLKSKRWDLGPIPNYRGCANLSVVCDDIEDLHPLFWKTYEQGEPFGLVNRKNIQQFARMGEKKKDAAVGVNPCAEATLEPFEPCNLQEIALPNLDSIEEFEEAAVLMHRYGKRVTLENYHIPGVQAVIKKNRRVGTGITGCLQAPNLFNPAALDRVYQAVQKENRSYSKTLGIEESVRTTVIKPSGTMSKVMDCAGEGIHAAYSRHMIQRVRFSSSDPLVAILKTAGHHIEPQINFDGTLNHGTVVVDFYIEAPAGTPVADEQWDTWKQLDVLKMAQKHWADQAVSVTVYYRKEEIEQLKEWLGNNLKYLKTISFLCHNDHGFKQAPKEAITKEEYDKLAPKITSIDMEAIHQGELDSLECAGGACPIK